MIFQFDKFDPDMGGRLSWLKEPLKKREDGDRISVVFFQGLPKFFCNTFLLLFFFISSSRHTEVLVYALFLILNPVPRYFLIFHSFILRECFYPQIYGCLIVVQPKLLIYLTEKFLIAKNSNYRGTRRKKVLHHASRRYFASLGSKFKLFYFSSSHPEELFQQDSPNFCQLKRVSHPGRKNKSCSVNSFGHLNLIKLLGLAQ